MSKVIANPTRLQYLTVCGGLPRQEGERKANDFSEREKREIELVIKVLGDKSSWWFQNKFMGAWGLFPLSEDCILTVSVEKGEVYTSPTHLLEKIVKDIWNAIGNPTIQQEEDGSLSFYVEYGVWPYLAEDSKTGTLLVEDRIIDIDHVRGLVEDRLSDIMTWFWSKPAFAVVRMVRDLIGHIDTCGFDESVTKKLGFLRKVVHPWADKAWEASSAIEDYPYDRVARKEETEE